MPGLSVVGHQFAETAVAAYVQDIEPKGFQLVEMDGFVSRDTALAVRRLLENEHLREDMVQTNYKLARQYYGFEALQNALSAAFGQVSGTVPEEVPQ